VGRILASQQLDKRFAELEREIAAIDRPRTGRPRVQGSQCKVDDCFAPTYAYDLCSRHYYRQRMYGDPLATGGVKSVRAIEAWARKRA
jgi:hypothetical protein